MHGAGAEPMPGEAEVGRIFREESGRSVAALIRVFGDIDIAEDAVQEAFAIAASKWPGDGLPPNPGGWITTTARNRAIDRLRRESRGRQLLSEAAVDHLLKRRATCVTWNVVPRDWSDPYGWVDTALRQIGEQEESLVVLHDIPTGAMVHLERFIEGALALGAAFRRDFPDDCVLIREGSPTAALSAYVTRRQ